jgi:hydrogenase maturation protease
VARLLRQDQTPQVQISQSLGTMSEVRDTFQDAAGLIVVDAVVSGAPPGAIHRFDVHGAGIPMQLAPRASSHGWGVAEAVALGRLFQELPRFFIIYGIEGKNFDLAQVMSPEVATAIPEAARRIRLEIHQWLGRAGI